MKVKRIGRPKLCPDQEVALENYTARLAFSEARLARRIGGGNFSEGLRQALKHAAADIEFMESRPKKADKP